ncbi:MAG TPA: PQQ-dependent sugar dehydrogenase [Sphingomonadaceae bacterium]|nr:PQQ-dependent sugar dehydrogenase [Sphingomonadaceae bacterium]
MHWLKLASLAAALSVSHFALAQDAPPPPADGDEAPTFPFRGTPLGEGPWDFDTEMTKLHVEVVSRELETPWSLAFLPDGGMLVTERTGRLRIIRNGVLDPQPIAGLPDMFVSGLGGLMDIALHPDFANNRLIYLSYSKPSPDAEPAAWPRSRSVLAVMRAKWDGGHQLTEVEDIFVADAWYGDMPLPPRCCGQGPAFGSYGGRIAFDQHGYLFVTSGDRNYGEMVQDPSNHFGKTLRLNDDGTAPDDNPFVGWPGWKPEIWSLGHRNPLGLAFDPETGVLWSSEFGPRGGDELNIIARGANYGWINVTQGHHYNGEEAKGIRGVASMTDPIFAFGPPSINPGNVAVYRGELFPGWKGDLFMPTMSRKLVRLEVFSGHVTAMEEMLGDLGQRFRDVKVGPDGAIYILTDERDGALLKLTPGAAEEAE